MDNIDLTDYGIGCLIEVMGMFIHDLDVIINNTNDGIYTEDAYNYLAKSVIEGNINLRSDKK